MSLNQLTPGLKLLSQKRFIDKRKRMLKIKRRRRIKIIKNHNRNNQKKRRKNGRKTLFMSILLNSKKLGNLSPSGKNTERVIGGNKDPIPMLLLILRSLLCLINPCRHLMKKHTKVN
jgi:hypothetical protein